MDIDIAIPSLNKTIQSMEQIPNQILHQVHFQAPTAVDTTALIYPGPAPHHMLETVLAMLLWLSLLTHLH